jgi:hypothetical protein
LPENPYFPSHLASIFPSEGLAEVTAIQNQQKPRNRLLAIRLLWTVRPQCAKMRLDNRDFDYHLFIDAWHFFIIEDTITSSLGLAGRFFREIQAGDAKSFFAIESPRGQ